MNDDLRRDVRHDVRHDVAAAGQRGLALLAVLFALTLLMMLALPFAVSMNAGADAASRLADQATTAQSSASVRDLQLANVALSHPALDPTPHFDGLDEYPAGVDVPAKFSAMTDGGRVLLGGEVVDLQRFLALDGASPLLLANVLGTAGRLREDLAPDAAALPVDDASRFPDSGYVWLAGEVIRYEQRDGNNLIGLERGQLRDAGFADGSEAVAAEALVLDYRCVLAAAWPFLGRDDGTRSTRQPWRSVGDLLEIERGGFGAFSPGELAALERVFTVSTHATNSATWGRPERVFSELQPGQGSVLQVKSATHLGAGSTVRIRDLQTGVTEYGLVMAVASQRPGAQMISLPSMFQLTLLMPVAQGFTALDTVVEPLVPPPVNVNTAPREVLEALFANLRRSADLRVPDASQQQRRPAAPPAISTALARELADAVCTARMAVDGGSSGPFTGWQDLVERLVTPRLEGESQSDRDRWIILYRNLRTGRDSLTEMGTSPVCFASGPWVRYRAAASRSRSIVAPGVVGRHERTGTAAVVPGYLLEHSWTTQRDFEDAFVLDRRAPYWVTSPINLGHPQGNALGEEPASRYFPHLEPLAYPGMGLGAARFPTDDTADAGAEPGVATAPYQGWGFGQQVRSGQSFAFSTHRRGWDLVKAGPFLMNNTGPQGGGSGPGGGAGGVGSAPQVQQPQANRHDQVSFPFSTQNGFMNRFGVGFWAEPSTLQNVYSFDHDDGNPNRNRFSLVGRDGNLVLEVLDEAGLDPNPSASPAGVQRTSSRIEMNLADISLPSDTPVHLNLAATSGRPADLSLAVDGVPRGKPKFVTYLTQPLSVFDPNLANNNQLPGQSGNDRYLNITVEDTTGFPPVGVLRIGLELFEYSGISGNSFQCQYKDSLGGRAARQIGREHRPQIPLDQNGVPVVDINDPQFNNVNLDVFPAHPVGAMVELYGYSIVPSESTAMMVGTTQLSSSVGAWAVARGFVANNPRPITVTTPNFTFQLGTGIDTNWTGELSLADPVPTGNTQPPNTAQQAIADAFPTGGGYALLVQRRRRFEFNMPGQISGTPTFVGGVELIRYTSRNGVKLSGVQRAQTIPGLDSQISRDLYDGTAHNFVQDWNDVLTIAGNAQTTYDMVPTLILWVVPVSIPVSNASVLWDPRTTGLTEWVQLYPQGNEVDTEWVRYDAILNNADLVRGNRAAWSSLQFQLTQSIAAEQIQVNPQLGATGGNAVITPPWGTVQATSGFIGYVPQLESQFPQIAAARRALAFRGDPFTGTSSHAQANATVMQCQRLQLPWGNHGAYTGRVGRQDRVALIQGSTASGTNRPNVEWHTVNWQARRYNSDNLQQGNTPPELLGPWPFQLVAFKDGIQVPLLGPARGTAITDTRQFDRLVKFPSGELPSSYCASPAIGSGANRELPMRGVVDEVEITSQLAPDIVLDQQMTDSDRSFTVHLSVTLFAGGTLWSSTEVSSMFPQNGGLVQIDQEILAYQSRANGVFQVAQNGRALLGTKAKGHDRGARVMFLTHRPAAILAGGVGATQNTLTVQAAGPLPRAGTLLLGRELLHYTWSRNATMLEMPRWYPPAEDGFEQDRSDRASRGLFRGRYGTVPQGASSGEVVIAWPFRYWDRYHEYSDDPELAYFQVTADESPVLFRSVSWREETRDANVQVHCRVRTDSLAPWAGEPGRTAGLWEFRNGDQDVRHKLDRQASRLEVRFQTEYRSGAFDPVTGRSHGWKTTGRIENVRVEYEGERRIFDEQVTAR
ncbi:MAG: hypothetical protein H6835_12770 [Planctomycetes bacterium]|nr:hypothetical protein [Planctomycetota bacterium]